MISTSYTSGMDCYCEQQLLSTLPPGFAGTNFTSEVRVSANGAYVYAANRLNDTIGIFSVDPRTGQLTFSGRLRHSATIRAALRLVPKGATSFRAISEATPSLLFVSVQAAPNSSSQANIFPWGIRQSLPF